METQEDMVMMRAGKVMVKRNGETTAMTEEVTMADNTRVMPNGQVIMPDGTTRMMHDGETMMMAPRQIENPEEMSDADYREAMEDEENRDQIK